MDEGHLGWANYETWKVHLEFFDGGDWENILGGKEQIATRHDLRARIRDMVEDHIHDTTQEGLARDWALAFLSKVDWYEIADHIIPGLPEE